MSKDVPQDMTAYKYMFCTTRIPQPNSDIVRSEKSSKHIAVCRRGNFYICDVIYENNKIISASHLQLLFEQLIQIDNTLPANHNSFGYFTAANRDLWWTSRQKILNSNLNSNSLKDLEEAIFLIWYPNHRVSI